MLCMYLRPGEPIHGVGADFQGQLPAVQHLLKAVKKKQLINLLLFVTFKEKTDLLTSTQKIVNAADCSFKTN